MTGNEYLIRDRAATLAWEAKRWPAAARSAISWLRLAMRRAQRERSAALADYLKEKILSIPQEVMEMCYSGCVYENYHGECRRPYGTPSRRMRKLASNTKLIGISARMRNLRSGVLRRRKMLEHLSVSQLDMFTRCGEQYRRRYIEGEIIPPGISARIGTGVHKAAETNSRYKLATGSDMRLDAIQYCAADSYDKALREGVFFAPDELPGARKAMAEGKDTAVALAGLYHSELAPALMPRLVEEKIWLDFEDVALPILTVLDLYTEDNVLHDLKTSGRKWSEDKADSSHQPTAYREAIRQATGEYPDSICFDVLVSSKTPAVQTLATSRDSDDAKILARKFNVMLASINAGVFQPAEPGSWVCSQKFCGYFHTCPYIPAHRKIMPKRSQ